MFASTFVDDLCLLAKLLWNQHRMDHLTNPSEAGDFDSFVRKQRPERDSYSLDQTKNDLLLKV